MPHPADEPRRLIILHGWLPAFASSLVLGVSVLADLQHPGLHRAQRSGSIITVLGAYVAFVGARRSLKFIDDSLYMNIELPYAVISIALAIVGTLTWGHADLVLHPSVNPLPSWPQSPR